MAGVLSKQNVINEIRNMDPFRFEQFIAEVWENLGFKTTVRNKSGDRGIDIVAEKENSKQLIQVKRYSESNKIGSADVRKYATLYQQVADADKVVIVTSGFFTSQARKLAEDLDVETISADELFDIVNSHSSGVVTKYLHGRNQSQIEEHLPSGGSNSISNNSSVKNSGTNNNNSDQATIKCKKCNQQVTGRKKEYVGHWEQCELPDDRPTQIPVDLWWDIKDEFKDERNISQSNGLNKLSNQEVQELSGGNKREYEYRLGLYIEKHFTAILALVGLLLSITGGEIMIMSDGIINGIATLITFIGSFCLLAAYIDAKESM
ncbi:restriction endonuclease [Haloarcula sp. H-GB5]